MFDKIKYVIGENKVSFGQNASGTWKCNEITINCKDVIGVIKNEMKGAMQEATTLIDEFNGPIDDKIKKAKAAKQAKKKPVKPPIE